MDCAPVRFYGNDIWQLAFRRKVAGDVPAICGVETKVCRPLPRIEHDSPPLEFVAHEIKWRDEVRIA